MKKIILLLAAVLMVCGNSFAQSAANRTWKTKVSDALALFPAPDAAEYNRLMGDLVSTGADGVKMLVEMLDNTNNAPVCYALSGWANFVSQNPQGRDTFVAGILNGLEQQAKDPKQAPVAVFYISLLQRCAVDDHTIEVLASLMDHAELSSPALNAMVSLGGAKVQKLIAEAFLAGKGNKVQLAKAVGDVDAAKADPKVEAALIAQLGTDPVLNQTLYYALSKTGTVASLPVLRNAASKVGFEGESTNATDSYIMLIKRLYREGLVKEATAEASRLQKLCKKEGPEHARIAAMEVLLSYQGERMIGTVVKAMEDPSRLYRNSMLNFTQGLASPDALNEALLSALPKLKSEEAQTD
ncbi:MAG: hypothetical protein PHV49_00060, partial [Alistipes sp.]|nr:hypothetical protein [Alistipes sp.]